MHSGVISPDLPRYIFARKFELSSIRRQKIRNKPEVFSEIIYCQNYADLGPGILEHAKRPDKWCLDIDHAALNQDLITAIRKVFCEYLTKNKNHIFQNVLLKIV